MVWLRTRATSEHRLNVRAIIYSLILDGKTIRRDGQTYDKNCNDFFHAAILAKTAENVKHKLDKLSVVRYN